MARTIAQLFCYIANASLILATAAAFVRAAGIPVASRAAFVAVSALLHVFRERAEPHPFGSRPLEKALLRRRNVQPHRLSVQVNPYSRLIPRIARRPNRYVRARQFVRLVLLLHRPTRRHQHLHDRHQIAELALRRRRRFFRPVANVLCRSYRCCRCRISRAGFFRYLCKMHVRDRRNFRRCSWFVGKRRVDRAARGARKFHSPIRRRGASILFGRAHCVKPAKRRCSVFKNFLHSLAQLIAACVLARSGLTRRFDRRLRGCRSS